MLREYDSYRLEASEEEKPIMMPPKPKHTKCSVRSQFYKSSLCKYYNEGYCSNGATCLFAHGRHELTTVPNLAKTSLCAAWKRGQCTFDAAECPFAHGKRELRATPGFQSRLRQARENNTNVVDISADCKVQEHDRSNLSSISDGDLIDTHLPSGINSQKSTFKSGARMHRANLVKESSDQDLISGFAKEAAFKAVANIVNSTSNVKTPAFKHVAHMDSSNSIAGISDSDLVSGFAKKAAFEAATNILSSKSNQAASKSNMFSDVNAGNGGGFDGSMIGSNWAEKMICAKLLNYIDEDQDPFGNQISGFANVGSVSDFSPFLREALMEARPDHYED